MKRTLIVAALLLMIVTSLSAGTLAVYTSTADLAVLDISAKKFALSVDQGAQSEFDLKIAPGEMVSYYFDVANSDDDGEVAEVDMDLMVQGDFSNLYDALPGISVRLLADSGSGYTAVAQASSSGVLSYSKPLAFSAGESGAKHFILSFEWADSDSARQLITSGKTVLPLTLYVRGTQHVS